MNPPKKPASPGREACGAKIYVGTTDEVFRCSISVHGDDRQHLFQFVGARGIITISWMQDGDRMTMKGREGIF